jgi:8-amino-7-oxononanoate synthase
MNKLIQIQDTCNLLKASANFRETHTLSLCSAAHVTYNKKTALLLASNNYLGLTHHPKVQAAAKEAVERYGTGSGGSRLTSGTHPLYEDLEKRIASFKQESSALIFSTGYMANVGVISALADKTNDVIFSDELNHASIIDGCRLSKGKTLIYSHSNMDDLAKLLKTTPCSGQRFILTDGVFSMDGDIAKLDEIVYLAQKYDAMVMVDDAHATGVIGPDGKGTAAHYNLCGKISVEIGTLSKSLAAEGGFVAGSDLLINYLMNKARSFIFSTALSPASIASADTALQVLQAEPWRVDRLKEKSRLFKTRLLAAGLDVLPSETPILPILTGSASRTMAIAANLEEHGLLVSAIRPPTVPQGQSRLRLTVTDAHNEDELVDAAARIGQIFKTID